MSENLIRVDEFSELVIPQRFNISIFGENEPTYPCFEISVGNTMILLERSSEHPYNQLEDDETDMPSYLTWWDDVKYEIRIPSYYIREAEAEIGDAYQVKVIMVDTKHGAYAKIELTKV